MIYFFYCEYFKFKNYYKIEIYSRKIFSFNKLNNNLC